MRIACKLLVVACAISIGTSAQFLKVGPKAGANLLKIDGQSFSEGYQLGYYAGIFAELKLGKNFFLQPEVLFNETQFDQSKDFRDIYRNVLKIDSLKKIKLQTLSLPLTLNWKIANILSLSAGPQFSIFMKRGEGLFKNAGAAITEGDVAMLAGLNIHIGKLRVSGRYSRGLRNINNQEEGKAWKQQAAQVGLGLVL